MDILSIMAIPKKHKATLLGNLAEEVAHSYLTSKEDPSKTIARLSKDYQLNREDVERVVELSNQLINRVLSEKNEDQLFTFPVATAEKVYKHLDSSNEEEGDVEPGEDQKAAEYDPELVAMVKFATEAPDYYEVARKVRWDRHFENEAALAKMAKMAEEAEESNDGALPAPVRDALIRGVIKKAEAELEAAKWRVQEKVANLREYWRNLPTEEDKLDFVKAAAIILGPEAYDLVSSFGEDDYALLTLEKSASELEQEVELVEDSPIVVELRKLAEDLDLYDKKRKIMEQYEQAKQKLETLRKQRAGEGLKIKLNLKDFFGSPEEWGRIYRESFRPRAEQAYRKIRETIQKIKERQPSRGEQIFREELGKAKEVLDKDMFVIYKNLQRHGLKNTVLARKVLPFAAGAYLGRKAGVSPVKAGLLGVSLARPKTPAARAKHFGLRSLTRSVDLQRRIS